MKKSILPALLAIIALMMPSCKGTHKVVPLSEIEANRTLLPNGWSLTAVGKLIPAGDLPLNIAVSPAGDLAAVTNNGQSTQTIQLLNLKTGETADTIIIGKSWVGITFSDDGRSIFASGGNDNLIIKYSVNSLKLAPADTFIIGKPWPEKISIAGIALDEKDKKLYAVTKEDNSLYVVDTETKEVLSKNDLGGEGYTCLLSPDHKILYVTCWGCDKVLLFDTGHQQISGAIAVGDNPNDMCISRNGKYLFVANANDNSVSVIDSKQQKVIETLNTALYPDSPSGSTTNSVALSKDEKTLYAANADNNCLAVFDVAEPGRSKSKGFIPTGWYPTTVRTIRGKLIVADGKGLSSHANPYGPDPTRRGEMVVYQEGGKEQKVTVQYIAGLLRGTIEIIDEPGEEQMGIYSRAVYNNTPYSKERELLGESEQGNPIPSKVGDPSPVKYVFYIIKENRTYDQVFGDMPEGNGDSSLVLFGENVTPNHHAIAREFVLLDNFYVNGEVSADGHNWSLGAYATDFLEKNWPTSYGSRGGTYPGEGTRAIANNKDGFLWDLCQRSGVTFRTYGEFMGDDGKPNIPVLEGHFCKTYTPWVQSVRDTVRFRQWRRDFDSLLAKNAVPQMNTIRFINDHTEGLGLNKPTPFAHVADNDLAVGMFVDYLSHSRIWNESLVLVVEDDAQNGPDHVDAHRSGVLIAGGLVKQGFVDHTPYTTTSLLRTMELILGMPPMTQYDAASNSLWRCLDNTADHPPYKYRLNKINLNDKNYAVSEWQRLSETFDFSAEDRVNDLQFNEVIWRAVKGLDSPCPPAVRAAFLQQGTGEEEEEGDGD